MIPLHTLQKSQQQNQMSFLLHQQSSLTAEQRNVHSISLLTPKTLLLTRKQEALCEPLDLNASYDEENDQHIVSHSVPRTEASNFVEESSKTRLNKISSPVIIIHNDDDDTCNTEVKKRKFEEMQEHESSSDESIESHRSNEKSGKKKLYQTEKVISYKPGIEPGITYDEIDQAYCTPELKEWCLERGIKISGTQREIINRILMYLAGDTESTTQYKKKKKRKKINVKPIVFTRGKKKKVVIKREADEETVSMEKKRNSASPKKKTLLSMAERIEGYTTELAQLADMGFTESEKNVQLLDRFGGSMDRTIHYLIGTPLEVKTRQKDTM